MRSKSQTTRAAKSVEKPSSKITRQRAKVMGKCNLKKPTIGSIWHWYLQWTGAVRRSPTVRTSGRETASKKASMLPIVVSFSGTEDHHKESQRQWLSSKQVCDISILLCVITSHHTSTHQWWGVAGMWGEVNASRGTRCNRQVRKAGQLCHFKPQTALRAATHYCKKGNWN